jgi:hypothetical protein
MILNSTKFGGNQTKDVEVGPDRQTGRFLYTLPNYVCGGIILTISDFLFLDFSEIFAIIVLLLLGPSHQRPPF